MLFVSQEEYYFTGVEDRSFTSREDGQNVPYYRYTFVSGDESGTAVSFGSDKPFLCQKFKKFDICYPEIDVSFSSSGAKVRLKNVYGADDVR